mmetsp:Transcript_83740/g.245549  ORF Transcript_83740/g.245549 Transcript_83740/m.245549 type:complete len:330 (-) Transcript_83740:28-1017(-)
MHAYCGKGPWVKKTACPMIQTRMLPMTTMQMFTGSPAFRKSLTPSGFATSMDLARIAARGGVAVGIMNAKELATVAGSSKAKGCMKWYKALSAKITMLMAAHGTPPRSCEQSEVRPTITNVLTRGVISRMYLPKATPMTTSSPVSSKPLANVNAPPISSSWPHSTLSCANLQGNTGWPGFTSEGKMKTNNAQKQLTQASFSEGSPLSTLKISLRTVPEMAQRKICRAKTEPATISSRVTLPSWLYSTLKKLAVNVMPSACLAKSTYKMQKLTTRVATEMGRAKMNHFIQVTLLATITCPARKALAGLPMIVAMPPARLPKPMPRSRPSA